MGTKYEKREGKGRYVYVGGDITGASRLDELLALMGQLGLTAAKVDLSGGVVTVTVESATRTVVDFPDGRVSQTSGTAESFAAAFEKALKPWRRTEA